MKLWRLLKHPRRGVKDPRGEKLQREGSKRRATTNSIDVVTKQMNAMSSGSGEVKNAFLKFIGTYLKINLIRR